VGAGWRDLSVEMRGWISPLSKGYTSGPPKMQELSLPKILGSN
jgi:hypothetical protein